MCTPITAGISLTTSPRATSLRKISGSLPPPELDSRHLHLNSSSGSLEPIPISIRKPPLTIRQEPITAHPITHFPFRHTISAETLTKIGRASCRERVLSYDDDECLANKNIW